MRVVRVPRVAQRHHLGVNLTELSSYVRQTVVEFLLTGDQAASQQHPRRAQRSSPLLGFLGCCRHDLGGCLWGGRRHLGGGGLGLLLGGFFRFLDVLLHDFSRSSFRRRLLSTDLLSIVEIFLVTIIIISIINVTLK